MFKSISATNFLSWEQLDFDFQSGVTLIEGWNDDDKTSEGSGKSAILNALCWGLFGQLPKDAKVDDVIREGAKSCFVEIKLQNGLMIVRGRKPNTLYIADWEVEKSAEMGKDAKETQKMIENLIGMSFETFCQSVYFAQNYPNKFVTANEADRAKILSELQDLSVFDKASRVAMEKAKDIKSKISLLDTEYDKANYASQLLFTEINKLSEILAQLKSEQERKLTYIDLGLAEARKELEESERVLAIIELEDATTLSAQYKEALGAQYAAEQKYETAKEQVQMLEKALSESTCPTCKQKLPKRDVHNLVIPDVARYKQNLDAATLVVEALELKVTQLLDKQEAAKTLEKKVDRAKARIEELGREKARVSQDESPTFQLRLKNLSDERIKVEQNMLSLEQKKTKLQQEFARYDILRAGFKEVKSYTFQSLLAELTRKANGYLRELFEVPVQIHIDNEGLDGEISKINIRVTIDGEDRPLGLYSGGQFRRIQLAVDLALSDIISARSDKPVNLLILDEYFKDLSETSMEKVLYLLEKLQRSVILIEHNSIFKSIISNVVKIELKGGVSRKI